jgi:hypothetical protein
VGYYTIIAIGLMRGSVQEATSTDYEVCTGTDYCTGGVIWADLCNESSSFGDPVEQSDLPIEESPGVVYPWTGPTTKVRATNGERPVLARWLFRSRATMY